MSDQPEVKDQVKDEEKMKEEEQNKEKPASKRALIRPLVASLTWCADKLRELTHPELDDQEDVSGISAEAKSAKQLIDQLLSVASGKVKQEQAAGSAVKPQYQYVAKIQGLRPQHFKDLRNILQNALGLGSVKFSPTIRNSPYVQLNFTTEEIMTKALKIVREKPLGLSLCVVETKKVAKARLPPESVLDAVSAEFDPILMFKESLLRSRELTEEEHNRMLEWKKKFIQHLLMKMCDKLDPEVFTIVKDRTENYFFKVENIRSTAMSTSESERYQTYSGVNKETGKLEMGYWALGSDIPSRIPRTACVRNVLKVLTDFMESSEKALYDPRVQKGHWDSVMIRSNHAGQCMVVLIVRCASDADAAKDCEALKPQLAELFDAGAGKDCGVKSVHLKILTARRDAGSSDARRSAKAGTWHFMYGEEHLDEEVAGLKVRLYRNTFFWGDGGCTEELCSTIADELGLTQDTGVLEMGVATGLICMYLAKRCKVVCGLDRVQTILPLAKSNVELNGLDNVVLVQGSPTNTVASLKVHFNDCSDVYAVVTETSSNARGKDEILSMRKSPWVKKVAYLIISYKVVQNSLRLMCSKNVDSSDPFVIVKVIPFDVASTNVRPDILLLLERASAMEDRVEKRVPKTKPAQPAGPPAKKAKMTPGAGNMGPRALLAGKKFGGGPPVRQPLFSNNRGFMPRGFGPNQMYNPGFGPQRAPSFPWSGDNARNPMLPFNGGAINALRVEEEALLLEHARRQKEAQLQQMQEVMLEAQRRRLADALLPSPAPAATPNIEEVVLSAIKKTGLLEKVAALTDAPPPKPKPEAEAPRRDSDNYQSRFKDQQSSDHWQPNYNQRPGGESRPPVNEGSSGYQARNLSGYQDRDSSGFQDRKRDASGYQARDMSGYQDYDSSNYQGRDRNAPGFQNRGSFGFQDRDSSGYQGRDNSGYQDRDSFGFQGRDSSGFQGRDSSGFQGRDSSGYQDRDTGYQNRDVLSGDSVYNSSGGYFGNASYGSLYGSQQ